MDQWSEIIVEWINCLGMLDISVSEISQLQNGTFYNKIIEILSKVDGKSETYENIDKFIECQYPLFFKNQDTDVINRDIYITSLLLLHLSQESMFHEPMCTKLRTECQLKIKSFLELAMVYEKSITKDLMDEVISEIGDTTVNILPMTPKSRPGRSMSSPAARSARSQRKIMDRSKELRQLRSELETERFEKIDLQEDLRVQERKIQTLQEKLQEKIDEIKALKEERHRVSTPQTHHRTVDHLTTESILKRELDIVERENIDLHLQVQTVLDEKDDLLKKITAIEKKCHSYKEKFNICQASTEALQNQMDLKDSEINELRMENKELNMYVHELNKACNKDQSIEMEDTSVQMTSTPSFNTSEVLSSIVEIQLDEAKTEIKTLHKEVQSLQQSIVSISDARNEIKHLNTQLQIELDETKEKLSSISEAANNMQEEKKRVEKMCEELQQLLELKEKCLIENEKSRNDLNTEITNLRENVHNCETLLQTEGQKYRELQENYDQVKLQNEEYEKSIEELTECHLLSEQESNRFTNHLRQMIHLWSGGLSDEEMNNLNCYEITNKLHNMFQKYENIHITKNKEIDTLNSKIDEMKSSIAELTNKVSEIKLENAKQYENELKLQNLLEEKLIIINEQNQTIERTNKCVETYKTQEIKMNENLRSLSIECNLLQGRIADLISDVNSKKAYIESSNVKIDELLQKIDNLSEVQKQMEAHHNVSIEKIEAKLTEKEEEIKKLTSISDSLIQELKNKITEMDKKEKESQEEAVNMKDTIRIKQDIISKQNDTISSSNTVITDLKAENRNLLTNIQEQGVKSTSLQQQISNLLSEKKLENEKIKNIETENQNLKIEKQLLNEEKKELEATLNSLEQKLSFKHEEYENLIQKSTTAINELQNQNSILQEKEKFNSDKIIQLETAINEHDELINKQSSIISESNLKIKNLENEKEKLSTVIDDLNNKIIEKERNIDHLQSELTVKQEEIDNFIMQLHNSNMKYLNLTKVSNEENKKSRTFIESLEKQVSEKDVTCRELQESLKLKGDSLESLESKLKQITEEHEASVFQLKEVIANLQEVRFNQEAIITAQEQNIKEKTSILEELNQEYSQTRNSMLKQIESEKTTNLSLENTICELKNEIFLNKNTVAELEASIKIKSDELNEVISDYQQLKEARSALDSTIMTLSEELTQLRDSNRESNKLVKEYSESKESFERQFKEENAKRLELEKTAEDFKNKAMVLECLIEERETSLAHKEKHFEESLKTYETEYIRKSEVEYSLKYLNASFSKLKQIANEIIFSTGAMITFSVKTEEFDPVVFLKNTSEEIDQIEMLVSNLYSNYKNLLQEKSDIESKYENSERINESMTKTLNKMEKDDIKRKANIQYQMKRKEYYSNAVSDIINNERSVGMAVVKLKENFDSLMLKYEDILNTNHSICDEQKYLMRQKDYINQSVRDHSINFSQSFTEICHMLFEAFSSIEQDENAIENLENLNNVEFDRIFSQEHPEFSTQLEKIQKKFYEVEVTMKEVEEFSRGLDNYVNNVKPLHLKREAEAEEKSKLLINQLTKEKVDLKDKLDALRIRNAKLERSLEDLRNEMKKVKTEPTTNNAQSIENLRMQLDQFRLANETLKRENEELSTKQNEHEFRIKLNEMHAQYDSKLKGIKENMKTIYNEQIAKIKSEQENVIRSKVEEMHKELQIQLQLQCQKHSVEINKYKEHVGELTTKIWTLSEKVLNEQQQKEEAQRQLREMSSGISNINIKREFIKQEEESFERRCSVKNMQSLGNAFHVEDEEGEVFNNVYLADIKKKVTYEPPDEDRLSVLQMRNAQCKPHLKSSYPVEELPDVTEDEVKSGLDNFNDSLSQSLLPEQKVKKKDRSQITYRKPGPPTPSKNGRRLSLQALEMRSPSSRILKERNLAERRQTNITPKTFKNLLRNSSSTSMTSKRHEENSSTSTPTRRRLSSLFRKPR